MILYQAMRMVDDIAAHDEPYQIRLKLTFPTMALTLPVDEFSELHLRRSVEDALQHKRPLPVDDRRFPEPDLGHDMAVTFYIPDDGLAGRLVRYYDLEQDQMQTIIDVRVF